MGSVPATADVVVVGGGITGVSTLYHLCKAGLSAVLVERDLLGSGSTSKAAGGIRAQFSDELNVRIMVEAIRRWERFESEIGQTVDFKQWGYLFLLEEGHLNGYRRSADMQRAAGVPVSELSADEAVAMLPGLDGEGITAAMFSPTDGYATPEAAVAGYAVAARDLGGAIFQSTNVTSLGSDGDRLTVVRTDDGDIVTPHAVVAAGVWTNEILRSAEIELPIVPEKRTVFLAGASGPLPHELPLTIDVGTGFYFHREGEGLLIAGRTAELDQLGSSAVRRLPFLNDVEIKPGWSGYYAVTPDHNPVIEASERIDGLYYAAGFSGHGFMQGPIVGDYLACLITGAEPTVDLSPFSSSRFESGQLRPETNVI